MNVHVLYRSGHRQHFVVPVDTTVVQFAIWARQVDPSGIKTCVVVLPERAA